MIAIWHWQQHVSVTRHGSIRWKQQPSAMKMYTEPQLKTCQCVNTVYQVSQSIQSSNLFFDRDALNCVYALSCRLVQVVTAAKPGKCLHSSHIKPQASTSHIRAQKAQRVDDMHLSHLVTSCHIMSHLVTRCHSVSM